MFFMRLIKAIIPVFKNIHFQSLVGNIIMSAISLGTMALLYRAMSLVEMGVYLFFITVLTLIDTVKTGILTNSFLKFYSGTERKRADEVAGSAWSLALIISGALVGVNVLTFLAASYTSNAGLILFLKYFSLIMLTTLPSFMANLVVQGEKRFDHLLWMRLINQLSFIAFIIGLIILKKSSLVNIIWAYAGSNMIASLATIFMGWSKIDTLRHSTRKTLLELFHFGKYSMGTSLSANLYGVTDTFFINFFLGPAALAVYNLAIKFVQVVEIPMLSFAASGMPSLASYYNNDQKADMMNLMKKLVGMLTLAFIGIALFSIAFAEPLIRIAGGDKYVHTAAPNLLRIVISIAVLYPIDRFFAITLEVIHRPKLNFYKMLIILAINLAGDFIGVTVFKSVYAVAIVNLFPVTVAIIISYIPLNRFHAFSFWNIFISGFKEITGMIKQTQMKLTGSTR